jgi:hypothetical protein
MPDPRPNEGFPAPASGIPPSALILALTFPLPRHKASVSGLLKSLCILLPLKIYCQIRIPIAVRRTNWSPCRLWAIFEACLAVSSCPSPRLFLHRHLFLALVWVAGGSKSNANLFSCHSFQVGVPLVLRFDV